MARITLSEGFSLIPEGTHVFHIDKTEYDEEFGVLKVHMTAENGQKHTERYGLMGNNNTPNEGAMNAFSYFAKAAMNDFSLKDIDPEELVGHRIECDVEHDTFTSNRTGKTMKAVRLTEKRPYAGNPANSAPAPKATLPNLADLLG